MASRRRRRGWRRWPRRIALIVAAPFLFVLVLLALPIAIPLAGWSQARADRRQRHTVRDWPCGWCGFPLGEEALARADAVHAAYCAHTFAEFTRFRMVRDLHACCPRCDAGHRYHETEDCFEQHHPRAFADVYGGFVADAVPPATLPMAWPWLPLTPASHVVTLMQAGVPDRALAVPPAANIAAIGEALLRAPWLPRNGGDTAWTATGADAGGAIAFGRRAGLPFVRHDAPRPIAAGAVASLHLHPPQGDQPQ